MYCCKECFKNEEIKAIIESISTSLGRCDYCKTENSKLVDAREIIEPFEPVIALYDISPGSTDFLSELLQQEWDIFNIDPKTISILLKDIFSEKKSLPDGIFEKPVMNITHNHKTSEGIIKQWGLLKSEIVEKNRFFLENVINLDTLEKYLKTKTFIYKEGDLFYRGRISTKEGFMKDEMGKPPAKDATPGRANPTGIPYLYLSTEKDTTVYEARAAFPDFVTIGTFILTKDIRVIKLRTVEIKSPFEEDIFNKLIYQPFLQSLELELSKPLRRFDSHLEYLPTQYLCEYIKHLGFDGVEYGSAMKKGGINLAIFDDSKFKCVGTDIVEIKDIKITY